MEFAALSAELPTPGEKFLSGLGLILIWKGAFPFQNLSFCYG
jgi:hypothetical protein